MKNIFDRINIWKIFKEHKDTMYDYAKYKKENIKVIPISDKFLFFYLPLIFSILLVILLNLKINSEYLNVIITSLSIFVGLLFSLLTLVFDLIKKEKVLALNKDSTEHTKNKYQLLKEMFTNISFAISLSIFTIVISLTTQIKSDVLSNWFSDIKYFNFITCFINKCLNIFAISFVLMFILTLLMILKRFYIVFKTEINQDH